MKNIFYDKEANLKYLKGKTVGIIGYGIQGRAQALNIRDSGIKVIVANRNDKYATQAKRDGFKIYRIDDLVKVADIILFLIPDQAQAKVYKKFVKNNLKPGNMLIFAHGYALRYETIDIPSYVDVAMLAPRMPGRQIREYFLSGKGVPAFVDVAKDASGLAWKVLLALSKAAGFTRAGVLRVSYKVEAELDLFMEQFLVSAIVKAIHTGFKVLVDEMKYPAVPTLMELYASGELAEVLRMASELGIGTVFQKNASPTCQYGIASHFNAAIGGDSYKRAKRIMKNVKNGVFEKALNREGSASYPAVRKLWKTVDTKKLVKTQEWINKNFKRKAA
ncbi:ketol-acid reductoisomerase [Candidatus Omnitrophota bacterium]